ncbi:transcription factor S [Candidatus Pacearchaeota archaeon]|nr:transcription factor S [Candidatus Pacearchaeota archaeon]
MEFCPKCGAILMMKTSRVGCPKCSYVAKGKVCMEMKEEVDEKNNVRVACGKDATVNPVTDWDCHACGSKKAEFWIRQMRSGDEPESKFYKCVKCGKTVRVDD